MRCREARVVYRPAVLLWLVWLAAPVLFFGSMAALIARRRLRRAWLGCALVLVVIAASALDVVAIYAAFAVVIALAVDAIRVLLRRPAPAESRGGPARWLHLVAIVAVTLAASSSLRAYVVEPVRISSAGMEPTLSIDDEILVEKVVTRVRGAERGEVVAVRTPCDASRVLVKRVVARAGDPVELRCGRLYVGGAAVPTTTGGSRAYRDQDPEDPSGNRRVRQTARLQHEQLGGHVYAVLDDGEPDPLYDFPPLHAVDEEMFQCPVGDRRAPAERERARGEVVTSPVAPAGACAPHAQFVVPAGHVFVLGDNRDRGTDSRFWGPVPERDVLGRVPGVWRAPGGLLGPDWDRVGAIE